MPHEQTHINSQAVQEAHQAQKQASPSTSPEEARTARQMTQPDKWRAKAEMLLSIFSDHRQTDVYVVADAIRAAKETKE